MTLLQMSETIFSKKNLHTLTQGVKTFLIFLKNIQESQKKLQLEIHRKFKFYKKVPSLENLFDRLLNSHSTFSLLRQFCWQHIKKHSLDFISTKKRHIQSFSFNLVKFSSITFSFTKVT